MRGLCGSTGPESRDSIAAPVKEPVCLALASEAQPASESDRETVTEQRERESERQTDKEGKREPERQGAGRRKNTDLVSHPTQRETEEAVGHI